MDILGSLALAVDVGHTQLALSECNVAKFLALGLSACSVPSSETSAIEIITKWNRNTNLYFVTYSFSLIHKYKVYFAELLMKKYYCIILIAQKVVVLGVCVTCGILGVGVCVILCGCELWV